jgi:hypothetical protein
MQYLFDLNGPSIHVPLPTIARSRFREMAVFSLCKTTILCNVWQKLGFNRLIQKVVRTDEKWRITQ